METVIITADRLPDHKINALLELAYGTGEFNNKKLIYAKKSADNLLLKTINKTTTYNIDRKKPLDELITDLNSFIYENI